MTQTSGAGTTQIRYATSVIVQTALDVPQGDEGWQTQPLMRFEGGSEDVGQTLGEAIIVQEFGIRSFQGMQSMLYVQDPQLPAGGYGGNIVRILAADPNGTTNIDGDSYTAFWWGVIIGPASTPDGAAQYVSGRCVWQCASIASVLANIEISNGYIVSPTSGSPATPGRCPPFNDIPLGDMSSTTFPFANGSANIHDLSTNLGTGVYWTAAAIVQLLLVAYANPSTPPDYQPSGFNWHLSDPSGALAYVVPTLDFDGMSILSALNELISEARGLTFYVTVTSAGVCTINVTSTSPTPITVPSGQFTSTYSFPAAVNTATLSIAGQIYLSDVRVTEDWTQVYDTIIVRGARPWVAMTYDFQSATGSALVGSPYGWSAGAETGWATFPSGIEDVWRRFQVATSFLGGQYPNLTSTNGLRNTLATGSGNMNGAGGLSGARSFTPSTAGSPGISPPAYMVRGEKYTPASPSWGALRTGPRQPPLVVVSSAGQTYWEDMSESYRIEVQEYPLAVVVDDQFFGKFNQAIYNANEAILVSIGVREVEPLQVSWSIDPASRVNGSPRVKTIDVPQCEQWIALAGTVTGINFDLDKSDGNEEIVSTLATLSSDTVIRDDTALMQSVLALAVPFLGTAAVNVEWTDRANLEIGATLRSGVLLTSLIRGDGTSGVNGIIRRSWSVSRSIENGVELVYHNTHYNTRRIVPDFGIVMASVLKWIG